ncbi:unnamed protein product [Protopolystoma xenopodis]|uniref:Uncharacterized protein n=1 Tax=Protopolystoma xenopodis TaxID=117903 RepID=A0A448XQ98_9PLAT|nr:unnamed protein product [Protopolystoma xenopodis]
MTLQACGAVVQPFVKGHPRLWRPEADMTKDDGTLIAVALCPDSRLPPTLLNRLRNGAHLLPHANRGLCMGNIRAGAYDGQSSASHWPGQQATIGQLLGRPSCMYRRGKWFQTQKQGRPKAAGRNAYPLDEGVASLGAGCLEMNNSSHQCTPKERKAPNSELGRFLIKIGADPEKGDLWKMG